jgi:hypothetical protein
MLYYEKQPTKNDAKPERLLLHQPGLWFVVYGLVLWVDWQSRLEFYSDTTLLLYYYGYNFTTLLQCPMNIIGTHANI